MGIRVLGIAIIPLFFVELTEKLIKSTLTETRRDSAFLILIRVPNQLSLVGTCYKDFKLC